MDAVKFLKERDRMCERVECDNCPIGKITLMKNCDYEREDIENIVEAVENWSKENPKEVGKKYIIEIDKVDRDRGRKQYHIKGAQGFWISDGNLTGLEEYEGSYHKGSEE